MRTGEEQQLRELSRHFAEHCPFHYASHFPVTEMRTSVLDRLGGDGADPSPWRTRAGVGLTHNLANGTEVSLRYDAESRSDFLNQGASIKARWAF